MGHHWENEQMKVPPQIIVRAFNDEPAVLFDYDIDDFQRLWEAFSKEDKLELARLYDELRQQPRAFMDLLDEHGPFK